ncbi:MAG: hypothetical protein U5Q16_12170 [Gammaproteobacteria bacterium]|nr:hypothetical protein [Gammaproteobacteria bacterium]
MKLFVRQPVEKGKRFFQLIGGQRRRRGLQFRSQFGQAGLHFRKVGYRGAHVAQGRFQAAAQLRQLGVGHAVDFGVNEYFALRPGSVGRQRF